MIIRRLLFALSAAAAFCISCSDELGEETGAMTPDGEFVSVTVDVSAGELTEMSGQGKTRSIDDPATASNTEIKNLWVLQYDGVGDDAKLITSRYRGLFHSCEQGGQARRLHFGQYNSFPGQHL